MIHTCENMELKWKPVIIFMVAIFISGSVIGIGLYLYREQNLKQIGFEVTRVEVETTYDSRYRAMFRLYFHIEHSGEENQVELRLYRHEEQGDSSIDTRFWEIGQDTEWVSMQFYRGEDETFQEHLYKLTSRRTELGTREPLSNEVTVWDGKTSNLSVLPYQQTFGVEVTKVEIGRYSIHKGIRDYTLRFYIYNHEEAKNVTFLLYREFYDTYRVHSSESPDSVSVYVAHGDAGYIELEAGAGESHEPTLDLKYYKLKDDTSSTLWYGRNEEPFLVENNN